MLRAHTARKALASALGQRRQAASASTQLMQVTADAYSEGPTTLVTKGPFKFVVDEPPKLGGRGLGPNPLTCLLGSLAACTAYTAQMVQREMSLPDLRRIQWAAKGWYDLEGVRGTAENDQDSRFQKLELKGTVDTDASADDLRRLASEVEKRCIVASTLRASGLQMTLDLSPGNVAHDCEPACQLHDLEQGGQGAEGGATGVATPGTSKDSDAPSFRGGRHAHVRAMHTLASTRRSVHSAASLGYGTDGEEEARRNLGAEDEPQIQKEQSEKADSRTAGGAYAARDSPRAQAAQPVGGKSDEQIVQEQGAGVTVHPASAGTGTEEGMSLKHPSQPAPSSPAEEDAQDKADEQELGSSLDKAKEFEPWKE